MYLKDALLIKKKVRIQQIAVLYFSLLFCFVLLLQWWLYIVSITSLVDCVDCYAYAYANANRMLMRMRMEWFCSPNIKERTIYALKKNTLIDRQRLTFLFNSSSSTFSFSETLTHLMNWMFFTYYIILQTPITPSTIIKKTKTKNAQ